jgi:predicted nucleic acid-binding protein
MQITPKTICLLDTNVVLRYAQRDHSLNPITQHAIATLKQQGYEFRIAPQNCIEFWNVATRPLTRNGFGLTLADADLLLSVIEQIFPLLPDMPGVYSAWRKLVVQFGVSGVQVHDARLVAIMQVYQITHILSFNTADFLRYRSISITVIDPATV